ncbi:hypothetical protein [Peribacillus frigoritolerans]|uniref:Uncharacterized protein n=1 Tax=Peribacillus frigoritolerans TaxID=450367 RepID=A0AAJ1QN31_9BACI|nr:hypothetical protein [Peribacillus frigoritolerans]MDM5284316.1 hypothetical protein [Peribacillus frigoritolerans]
MDLLFGDMIFALEQKNSGIIDETNMETWPNTMKNLMYVYNDAKIVIPGHKNLGRFQFASTYIGSCPESWKMN